MGSTVTRGEVEATVDATGMNTFFGKTASLIQVTLEFVTLHFHAEIDTVARWISYS
jgi:magnesium-transporting ATPase (P-type)